MKIYVIHYSKLIDRKKYMIEQFQKQNITDYEFIEKYDKENLEDYDKSLFDTHILKPSIISLAHKHFYTYKLISENYNSALILEDDAILSENFMSKLNNYITKLPANYDMLYIGDGCNLHIEQHKLIPNINIYEKCLYPTTWGGDGATRCCDSYIVSKKCALQLCDYINNIKNLKQVINLPVDWWLNVVARDNNFKIYWAEPTIVSQGSQNGLFTSSTQFS